MNIPDTARVRDLEKENARLKRLLAERDLEVDIIKELLQKVAEATDPVQEQYSNA